MRTKRYVAACGAAVMVLAAGAGVPAIAAQLPNGRAYEVVSPTVKNGGDVLVESSRVRAAADGGAVMFGSLGGFADVQGTGVGTEYLARRAANGTAGTNGWATHGITPPQDAEPVFAGFQAFEPAWEGEFSSDLSEGVLRAWSPLTDAAKVAQVENLYAREDLLTAGAGSYRLLTDCSDTLCAAPLPPVRTPAQVPRLAGASSGFDHIIFESPYQLAPDAPVAAALCLSNGFGCQPEVYKTNEGGPVFVGLVPTTPATLCGAGGAVCVAAPRSKAGTGTTGQLTYTNRTITSDGSRVFFTVGASAGATTGALYMRDDQGTIDLADDTTTAIAGVEGATERALADTVRPARFESASTGVDAQGTRVPVRIFLSTAEELTNDDDNTTTDLYMYDTGRPAGQRLTRLSVDHEDADGRGAIVQGVIGTDEDGHYIYFVSAGQLVTGKPALGNTEGIYVWHEGSVAYIGMLAAFNLDRAFNIPGLWNATRLGARVTPDGRHLLFGSSSGDGLLSVHGGVDVPSECTASVCTQAYLYDADDDSLVCASCNPGGAPPTAPVQWEVRDGVSATVRTSHLNHSLSNDGRFVFFSSSGPLVAEDLNGKADAYQYDAQTKALSLISTGTDASNSFFLDASADGHDAFFTTRARLVGWDQDSNIDLYDARVGGGFSNPVPAALPCAGDACQGAVSIMPATSAPASSGHRGAGNIADSSKRRGGHPRCKRGQTKRRMHGRLRCVKRKAHAKRRHPRVGSGQRRGK